MTEEQRAQLRALAESYTGNDLTRLAMLLGLKRRSKRAGRCECDASFRKRVLERLETKKRSWS